MIVVATHHKTGHHLMATLFERVSDALGLSYEDCSSNPVTDGTDLIVFEYGPGPNLKSRADVMAVCSRTSSLSREVFHAYRHDIDGSLCRKGIHTIRHPYEVIVSAYEHHKTLKREWVDKKRKNGLSYRESLLKDDGLMFEMNNASRRVIMEMYHWDYDDERFLNIKLEDFWEDLEGTARRVADWLDIDQDVMLSCTAGLDIKKNVPSYANNRTGKKWRWQNLFTDEHIEAFNDLFPKDTLEKLGYE
jgi:hypothetical protein